MVLTRLPNKIFCVQPAYHKGQWVYVPMFYVPKEALGLDGCLHRFQFIPLDGKELPIPSPRRSCSQAYENIFENAKKTILPWALSNEELEDLCKNNDIPLSWVTDLSSRETLKNKLSGQSSRRLKRKHSPLSSIEVRKVIKKLRGICLQSALIAEILWFINKRLRLGNGYITLEEVLRMRVRDVDPDNGVSTCISLYRSSPRGSHIVGHYLPKRIWNLLCKQLSTNSLFAFFNKNQGPLLPGDVNRNFSKAGLLAGIKESVCSLSFRPVGKKIAYAKQIRTNPFEVNESSYLEDISVNEWERLCSQIPGLIAKGGPPSTHDPRDILNAIFCHYRTRTPYRKLPSTYPPAKAVHSQYRRWLKKGIFDAILASLGKSL